MMGLRDVQTSWSGAGRDRFPLTGAKHLPRVRDRVLTFDRVTVGTVLTVGMDLFVVQTSEGPGLVSLDSVYERDGRTVVLLCNAAHLRSYLDRSAITEEEVDAASE